MDKLKKLEELFKIANDGLSNAEFLRMFEKITKHILDVEIKLIKRIDLKTSEEKERLNQLKEEFENIIYQAKMESDSTLGGIKRRIVEMLDKLFARNEINRKLNEQVDKVNKKIIEIDDRLLNIRDGIDGISGIDGKDGKDADSQLIIEEVLKKIKLPEIDKTEIDKLNKEIEELKSRPAIRGGGTSAIGVAQAFKWILKTEQPSGAINGVNKVYTVNHPIFAVLAFSLNGEIIAQLPNYTISGKTITFSAALPAVYSGKDFEIKYV